MKNIFAVRKDFDMNKIKAVLLSVINVGYSFLGWCIFIVFDLTLPDDPKFDLDPIIRIIIFLLMILHISGELFLLIKTRRIVQKYYSLFVIVNAVLIYIFPLWIGIIEIVFF
ncbi:MAG: hypothetical protein NC120_05525 [Ruminococcus sp.]|nr:hypothetical protein [Ruminococcus sp.]